MSRSSSAEVRVGGVTERLGRLGSGVLTVVGVGSDARSAAFFARAAFLALRGRAGFLAGLLGLVFLRARRGAVFRRRCRLVALSQWG